MENENTLRAHIEIFQAALMRARELEETRPPDKTFEELLATTFVCIARLITSEAKLKDEEKADISWLINTHIETVTKAIERFQVKKESGLPTEPSMN